MNNRYLSLVLSAASIVGVVLAIVASCKPGWCDEVTTQEQNLALLKEIDAQLVKKPVDVALLSRHAELMGQLKRYEDELADASKIIALRPNLKDGYLLRAQAQAKLNRNLAAIDSLNKAVDVGGSTPSVQVLKARLLRREKRYSEAIAIADQVIKENPSDYNAYDCRAGCYYAQNGACAQAIADLEAVVRLNPSDREAKALISNLRSKMESQTKTRSK